MPQFQDKQSIVDFLKDDDEQNEDVLFDAARETTQVNASPDLNTEIADSAAVDAAQKAIVEEATKKAAAEEAAAKEAAQKATVRKSAKTAAFQAAVK